MADEGQLAVLRQGVEAWNAWRQKNPIVCPNFRGASLHGADLGLAPVPVPADDGRSVEGAVAGFNTWRWRVWRVPLA
jgi:hypothetical protein